MNHSIKMFDILLSSEAVHRLKKSISHDIQLETNTNNKQFLFLITDFLFSMYWLLESYKTNTIWVRAKTLAISVLILSYNTSHEIC